jgi:hypothetical protein
VRYRRTGAWVAVSALIATAIAGGIVGSGPTANRFVSPTGSGTACTQAAPCASWASAYTAAAPGDTISVAAGTYTSSQASLSGLTAKGGARVTYRLAPGAQVNITNGWSFSGVDGITVDGTTGAGGQGINVSPTQKLDGNDNYVTIGYSTTVTNFTLQGATMHDNSPTVIGNVIFTGECGNVLIKDVTMTNIFRGDGVQIWTKGAVNGGAACNGITLDNVDMFNFSCPTNSGDHQDFLQKMAGSNLTVKNSTWSGGSCTGSSPPTGFQGWFISGGYGAGSNDRLENTVIANVGGVAAAVYIDSVVQMVNNTLDGFVNTETSPAPPSQVTFANNIVNSGSTCTALNQLYGLRAANQWKNNIFTGSGCVHAGDGDTSTTWAPMFTNAAGGDFTLASGSFAIGKALGSLATATDLTGKARDGSPDAGAYER